MGTVGIRACLSNMTSYQACFTLNDQTHRLWIETMVQLSGDDERFDLADGQYLMLPNGSLACASSILVRFVKGEPNMTLSCHGHADVSIERFAVATISTNTPTTEEQPEDHTTCILS